MINITDKAKSRLISVMDEEDCSVVRFGLQGGGCSGFQYYFAMENLIEEEDTQINLDETHRVVVDCMSLEYLTDLEIDYKKDMMGESFIFKNNKVTRSCGCGNSVGF